MAIGTAITATLKVLYPSHNAYTNLAQREHLLMSLLKKTPGFVGSTADFGIQYTNSMAIGPSFATVQANAGAAKSVKMNLSRKTMYGSIKLTGEELHAAKTDAGAFVDALKRETDAGMEGFGERINFACYRNKGGALGRISSISTNALTLTNANDVIFFYPGQKCVAASTDGTSGSYRDSANQVTVESVNLDGGIVNVVSAAAISGLTANDYLFPAAAAGDIGLSFNGLDAWIPTTAPSSTAFNGVDRTVDLVRLSGHRLDNTGAPISESIQALASRMSRTAKKGSVRNLKCIMNNIPYGELQTQLHGKAQYIEHKVGEVGWGGFVVHTAIGDVQVMYDPDCPADRAYILNMDDWDILVNGGVPHVVDDDGLQMARVYNEDAVEIRTRLWGDLRCAAPGRQGVVLL